MDRRTLLAAGAGLILTEGTAARAFAQGSLEQAAKEAWLYGIMLIENARVRGNAVGNTLRGRAAAAVAGRGGEGGRGALASIAGARGGAGGGRGGGGVTTPNNDTLYSSAWVDVSGGPVTLEIPNSGARYVSYALMDMYGNNYAIRGTRADRGQAKRFTIVGPDARNVSGPDVIRATTPWSWLLIRVLYDSQEDIPAANVVQDGVKLTGPQQRSAPTGYSTREAPWDEYFKSVQRLIVENPPPPADNAFFRRVSALGLDRAGGFDAAKVAARAKEIEAGVAAARAIAADSKGWGPIREGWSYPQPNLGQFGTDYVYRGKIAIQGQAALTPEESMYMRPVGRDGSMVLDSSKTWVLKFPRDGMPPVNAFWSLTAYAQNAAGGFNFVEGAGRRSIGDRTKGLIYGSDGSLEVVVSRTDPGGARSANWLPAPGAAPLGLFFRAYLAKPELLKGRYRLPALVEG